MTVDAWLTAAQQDARARGLEALEPLLETLARSTRSLRRAAERRLPAVVPPQDDRS